jgi:hypothetical protein
MDAICPKRRGPVPTPGSVRAEMSDSGNHKTPSKPVLATNIMSGPGCVRIRVGGLGRSGPSGTVCNSLPAPSRQRETWPRQNQEDGLLGLSLNPHRPALDPPNMRDVFFFFLVVGLRCSVQQDRQQTADSRQQSTVNTHIPTRCWEWHAVKHKRAAGERGSSLPCRRSAEARARLWAVAGVVRWAAGLLGSTPAVAALQLAPSSSCQPPAAGSLEPGRPAPRAAVQKQR